MSLIRLLGITKKYGEQPILREIFFRLAAGERVGLIGKNGTGKTTVPRLILGQEQPTQGAIETATGIRIGYFSQFSELAFFEARKKVEKFLGLLRFSELDMRQRIGTLSGGQRARVALALCLLSGAPVILLDEPTNHLDLTSTQVMERALLHFPGAVVFVSHDRFFIDKVATRLLLFKSAGRTTFFEGNWTLWQATTAETKS